MNCQAFIEQIIEQTGRPAPRPELGAHLAACASCVKLYREQRALWTAMDAWETPDISAGFDRQLYGRIGRRASGPLSSLDWLLGLLRPLLQPAFATALACMLIIATVVVEKDRHAPAPPQDAAVAIHAHERDDPQQIQLALDDIQMLSDFDALPVGQGDPGRT
ncbi:MAG TPA: hypothetical protein VEU62_15090 [Bryobacterales bacterium]|nr:hypothetical protein [Bryobacterales bacterium]